MKRFVCVIISLILTFGVSGCFEVNCQIDFIVDGEVVKTIESEGKKITMPKDPIKQDYVFEGWYWDEDIWEKPFTVNSIFDQSLAENNKYKVYAKFVSSVAYTVKFNANGGTGVMDNQIVEINKPIKLNKNVFSAPLNYAFIEWNTKIDGTGISYLDEDAAFNLSDAGTTVNLYAQWKEQTYQIAFFANGGTGSMSNQTAWHHITDRLKNNTFEAPKYRQFYAWNSSADGSGTNYFDGQEICDISTTGNNINLYAQWKYSDNVFLINKPSDFAQITSTAERIFLLQNDINFNGSYINPLCDSNNKFSGVFDGNGYTISNFNIRVDTVFGNASFFGYIDYIGIVKNLGLKDYKLSAFRVAAFANHNNGTIIDCYATGTLDVSFQQYSCVFDMGGIVNENYSGTIKNCFVAGIFKADINCGVIWLGGIATSNYNTIENCLFAGTIDLVLTDSASFEPLGAITSYNDDGFLSGPILNNCYVIQNYSISVKKDGVNSKPSFERMYGASSVPKSQLNTSAFFINSLKWSSSVWDFTNLNLTTLNFQN